MAFPTHFWWLFAAAMLMSSIGFKYYIWFISIGYGFAIAGQGLLMLGVITLDKAGLKEFTL